MSEAGARVCESSARRAQSPRGGVLVASPRRPTVGTGRVGGAGGAGAAHVICERPSAPRASAARPQACGEARRGRKRSGTDGQRHDHKQPARPGAARRHWGGGHAPVQRCVAEHKVVHEPVGAEPPRRWRCAKHQKRGATTVRTRSALWPHPQGAQPARERPSVGQVFFDVRACKIDRSSAAPGRVSGSPFPSSALRSRPRRRAPAYSTADGSTVSSTPAPALPDA